MSDWQSNAGGDDAAPVAPVQEAPRPKPVAPEGPTVGNWVERQGFEYDKYIEVGRDADAPAPPGPREPTGDWLASGARYEWNEEFGNVAPRDERLEHMLFGDPAEDHEPQGINFNQMFSIKVVVEGTVQPEPVATFQDAGLHPVMLENIILSRFEVPTPIQRYCIPAIIEGYDMLSCAQTGSGKTGAFLIPILSKLMGKAKQLAAPRPTANAALAMGGGQMPNYIAEPLVLIVSPTRELATQIFDECRRFCYRSMLRPCVVYGGADSMTQRVELSKGCDILVGTPGRIIDFLERGRILSLRRLKFTVVDEADEMLDMGFEPQLRRLLQATDCNQDDDQQVMMFSATFQKPIRKLATDFLADDYVQIKIGRIGSTHSNITQSIIHCEEWRKKEAIYDILCTAPPARTLIFVNHKRTADALDDYLYNLKLPTTSIHGDRTQREREDALLAFRSGKCPILIATGVAARGLDIKNVMHVINYDLPTGIDEYIHRIGRTARIGNHGLATSMYNDRNETIAEDLVKVMMESGQDIPEFLEQFKPDGDLNFDEPDSDDEEAAAEDGDGGAGDGWGDDAVAAGGEDADAGW